MDILSIASQLFGAIQENPDLLGSFVEHPYSTTAQQNGITDTIPKSDMSQIITLLATMLGAGNQGAAAPQTADLGAIADVASNLLGQNNGSAHELASALLGGAVQGAKTEGPKVDFSDGIGLDDVMGLAGMFFGK